jgi:hypothetical protein
MRVRPIGRMACLARARGGRRGEGCAGGELAQGAGPALAKAGASGVSRCGRHSARAPAWRLIGRASIADMLTPDPTLPAAALAAMW